MTGQPISSDSQDWRWYFGSYFNVLKITDAEASVPEKATEPKMTVMDPHYQVMAETGANVVPSLLMMEHGTGNTMAQLKVSRGRWTCNCGSCTTDNSID